MAENGSKRGPYKPLEKARIKQEIYKKILEGYSYEDIMEYLHMPERTFYRYLDDIKQEEQTFLTDHISPKQISWELRMMRDGLREDIKRMLAISSDPSNRNAVAAQHLASEIRCTVPKLYVEGLVNMLKTKDFPNNELNDESSRKTMRLVPVKDPETQLPLRYESRVQEKEKGGEEEEEYDELDGTVEDEQEEEE